ncbi:hypothetical protein C5167_019797 [Papaver somniferum]|uniref:Hydrophobic seed protein domain-containing protein n=1 Tax=Papaver somniferum TaxID=3469 RepID=A0A4Y7IV57_PAPSO|nr:hypothetical protein C5167_019797 [Papaver somniferum]
MASKSSSSPTLVGLLFALVVLSANLGTASAVGLSCRVGLALNITLLHCPADHCYSVCKRRCPRDSKVDAYACVLNLLGISLNGCSCCYIHI